METSWHSYPKVWALGHPNIKELFLDEVLVEEKIDGSQFSFGIFNGEIKVRSKGQEMPVDDPEGMFKEAVATVIKLAPLLKDGYTYRTEYLRTPKHNAITYERIPEKHLIVFDINDGYESYLSYDDKLSECKRIGLECVPRIIAVVSSAEDIASYLERESCLGKSKIEGIVFKNYKRFGSDKKVLMGKHVSEDFKEVNKTEWKKQNPLQGDILTGLINKYKTESRWKKSVQHLKEKGILTDTPKDIGHLMSSIKSDSKEELIDLIKEDLFRWAWPHLERGFIRGLPEWYKNELVAKQFEHPEPLKE